MEYCLKTISFLKQHLQVSPSVLGSMQAAFTVVSPAFPPTLPGSRQHLAPVKHRRQLCDSM